MEEKIRFALFGSIAGLAMVFGAQACTARPHAAGDYDTPGYVAAGPCEPDGTTRECHIETGRVGNIVNCFSGRQTCSKGAWGPCGGSDGEMSSIDIGELASSRSPSTSTLSPLTVSATGPSINAGACADNPCNPYCNGFDVDADSMKPDGGSGGSTLVVGTVTSIADWPGGLTGPKNHMSTYATTSSPAKIACTPNHPPADGKSCSSDYCCAAYAVGGTPNTCQPWAVAGAENPIAIANCAKATGVDFTLGLACNSSDGHVHVPACNRGTANATGGTVMIGEYPGNPRYAGNISSGAANYCNHPGNPSAYCLVNLATKSIAAGKCIDVDLTAGTANGSTSGVTCPASNFSNGNRAMMINPPTPPIPNTSAFSPAYTTLSEGDQCNNYSFHPSGPQGGTCSSYGEQPFPPPTTQSFTYTASCIPGFRVVWNQLGYDTTVPSDSQVLFKVSAAPKSADGGIGTYSAEVLAADMRSSSSPDPATCSITGSPDANVCPKNLATLLGVPAQNYEVLKVSVTQVSTSAISTVKSWRVSFNCVPVE